LPHVDGFAHPSQDRLDTYAAQAAGALAARCLTSAAMPILDVARGDLARRLELRREELWPEVVDLTIRYRGWFAYLDRTTADYDTLPLCRLRYLGTPHYWASPSTSPARTAHKDSVLPRGTFTGAREEASTAPAVSTSTTPLRGPKHPTVRVTTSDEHH
jgi:hypothetical protein